VELVGTDVGVKITGSVSGMDIYGTTYGIDIDSNVYGVDISGNSGAFVLASNGNTGLTLDALILDWLNAGRLDTLLDSVLEDTGTTIPTDLTTLYAIATADTYVDTTTTPWTLEYREAGTETVIFTKELRTTTGTNVTSTGQAVGQQTQPVGD